MIYACFIYIFYICYNFFLLKNIPRNPAHSPSHVDDFVSNLTVKTEVIGKNASTSYSTWSSLSLSNTSVPEPSPALLWRTEEELACSREDSLLRISSLGTSCRKETPHLSLSALSLPWHLHFPTISLYEKPCYGPRSSPCSPFLVQLLERLFCACFIFSSPYIYWGVLFVFVCLFVCWPGQQHAEVLGPGIKPTP